MISFVKMISQTSVYTERYKKWRYMKATIAKRRLGESSSCNSEERRVKVNVESKGRGGGVEREFL